MYQSKYFQNKENQKHNAQQSVYQSNYFKSGKNKPLLSEVSSPATTPSVNTADGAGAVSYRPLETIKTELDAAQKAEKSAKNKIDDYMLTYSGSLDIRDPAELQGLKDAATSATNERERLEREYYAHPDSYQDKYGEIGDAGKAFATVLSKPFLAVDVAVDTAKAAAKGETVDTNSLEHQKYNDLNLMREDALSETSGFGRTLAETGLSIADNLYARALTLGSGIGGGLSMGLSAAADKMYELNEKGEDAGRSLIRGAISGGIEGATEALPIGTLANMIKTGGKGIVKNLLKQGGVEATEEGISYVANYIADKAFKDPNAKFDWNELKESVVSGGLSGLFFGLGGTVIGNTNANTAKNPENQPAEPRTDVLATPALSEQKTAPSAVEGAEAEDYYFDESENNTSWRERTYTENGKTYVQSQDRQRMYEVPTQSEIRYEVRDDGSVVLDDDVLSNLSPKDYRDFAKAYAELNLVTKYAPDHITISESKPVTINSTGGNVIITQTGINEYAKKLRGKGIKNRDNVSSVLLLNKLIENATPVSSSDNVHSETGNPFTYYKSKFEVGGRTYNVTLHIKNVPSGDHYYYHALNGVDIEAETKNVTSTYGSPARSGEYPNEMEATTSGDIITPDGAAVNSGETESVGAAPAGFDPYSNMIAEYGIIPEGENPARMVDLPKSTTGKDRVSYSARNAMEAKATPEGLAADIGNEVVRGKFSYIPVNNKQAKAMAEASIKRAGSFSSALANWTAEVRSGKTSEKLTAMGALLYNEAANSGDGKLAMSILADYCASVRRGARAVQAARILKTLSPEYKLMFIQESVNKMNEAAQEKASRKVKAKDNVPVEQWMTRVGDDLAERLVNMAKVPESKAKTVSDEVLSDLTSYANSVIKKSKEVRGTKAVRKTAEAKFFDLLNNWEHYNEAIEAAKASILDKSEQNPAVLDALDSWLTSSSNAMLVQNTGYEGDIVVSEDYINEYLQAKTDEARDEALDKIYQNIADQVPSTLSDKFTALRYLNMLGNLKTQVRNIGGNALNVIVRDIDHHIQALIQSVYYRNNPSARTVSFTGDKDLRRLAKTDFESNKESAMGEQKYTTSSAAKLSDKINEKRTIFKTSGDWGTEGAGGLSGSMPVKAVRALSDKVVNPFLEGYRKLTTKAMDVGDEVFAKYAYSDAMSRYLKAKGYTAEQWSSGEIPQNVLDEARSHAISEAQEATFRDSNAFSDAVSKVGFKRPSNAVEDAINVIVEGVQPFKKTPANVAVQAEKHSPLGIINTAITAAKANKPGSEIDANDVIKSASESLTGIGLTLLGMALGAAGYATASKDEDDEKAFMDELTGGQEYAITIGDKSYTYDSLTPAAMPFALGVELQKAFERNGFTLAGAFEAVARATDVMLNMSMLSGVNDAIEKVSYSDYPAADLALNSAISYFTQGLTSTLSGQFERSTETQRMSTFRDKNNEVIGTSGQAMLGKASAKTPGFDYNQIPYIDAWGRTEETGNAVQRILNNFINPLYSSEKKETPADTEIYRLLSLGYENVAPDTVEYSKKVDGKYMDADQYVEYATTRGQTALDMVSDIILSTVYKGMSDEEKAEAINKAYLYAGHVAAEEITDGIHKSDKYVELAQTAKKDLGLSEAEYLLYYMKYGSDIMNSDGIRDAYDVGISIEEYVDYKNATKNLTANKDENGKVIDGSKKAKVIAEIAAMDIPNIAKDYLYDAAGYSASSLKDTPWH